MICHHQFIRMDVTSRSAENQYRIQYGVMTGCAICGQIRKLWENGEVEIVVVGKIIDEDAKTE